VELRSIRCKKLVQEEKLAQEGMSDVQVYCACKSLQRVSGVLIPLCSVYYVEETTIAVYTREIITQ